MGKFCNRSSRSEDETFVKRHTDSVTERSLAVQATLAALFIISVHVSTSLLQFWSKNVARGLPCSEYQQPRLAGLKCFIHCLLLVLFHNTFVTMPQVVRALPHRLRVMRMYRYGLRELNNYSVTREEWCDVHAITARYCGDYSLAASIHTCCQELSTHTPCSLSLHLHLDLWQDSKGEWQSLSWQS